MNNDLLKNYSSNDIVKYIRLSLSDDLYLKEESESVLNQRRIIDEFIEKNGINSTKCREYIDDGVSGTNFDRPGWIKLQEEMEKGTIKVLITKSLSRLGRSNFECSYYLDYYFLENNIRYIAIAEQIDTGNVGNTNNEYAALNNFINEKYSRDLSKNIKRVYRIKQRSGEYMGGIPVYGYVKDKNDKHKLIIDKEAAKVVRKIFRLYLKYHSQSRIIKVLSDNKIVIPEVYKSTKRGLKVKNIYEWNYHTIRLILRNEMYIGNMVQNVHIKKNFRDKKIILNKKDEWIIVKNTHEPIIDKKTFYRVQKLLSTNYRQPSSNDVLLKGLMYCYECGHRIGIIKPKKNKFYTFCNYYRKNSMYNKCSPHTINYQKLENEILAIIMGICNNNLSLIEYDNIIKMYNQQLLKLQDVKKDNIDVIEIEIKNIELKLEKMYMDYLDNNITLDTYKTIKDKLNYQKRTKSDELIILAENANNKNNEDIILDTNTIIKKYQERNNFYNRELVLNIIERIEIRKEKQIDLYLQVR